MQQVRVKVITVQDFSGLPSHAPPASPQGLPPLGCLTDLTQLSHTLTARPANYPQHSQEQPVWGGAGRCGAPRQPCPVHQQETRHCYLMELSEVNGSNGLVGGSQHTERERTKNQNNEKLVGLLVPGVCGGSCPALHCGHGGDRAALEALPPHTPAHPPAPSPAAQSSMLQLMSWQAGGVRGEGDGGACAHPLTH
ncbi:hypothetical protein E2C01_017843 [Portunus trituberculatus]|uniref:Uncharacterized protein n=1 Tax=Portunus trituberculatus TaxID=210409 RepID=A0A5B7DUM2_PORTR|nr:hypothetical protein [Portunus trituberculatus]